MKPKPETIKRNNQMIADYEKIPRESIARIAQRNQVSRQYAHKIIMAHYVKNAQ